MHQAASRAPETVLVTGATGFVGSHFVFHALRSRSAHVIAIVRGQDWRVARTRLCALLEQVATAYHDALPDSAFDRLLVLPGDLEQCHCGLDEAAQTRVRALGVDAFWNFAASLSFEDRNREAIERMNVGGTRNALALAEAVGAARYNQISTAYTCGQSRGEIPEQLHDREGPFNNHYERSKCEGEHLVADTCRALGRPFAIVRPSIVVGPEKTMHPAGSDSGLYGFCREIFRLKRALLSVDGALNIIGEPNAELNFVAVDQLVQDMWSLADEHYPAGNVYHMTSERSATVAETMSAVAAGCGVCPIVVHEARTDTPSPVERLFERRADFYASYMKYAKTFARSWGARRTVSHRDVESYVARYVATRGQQDSAAPFVRHTLLAHDAFPLCAFEAGARSAPALVLVNAYGMPVDYFVPLAKQLSAHYRLISWECRGAPSSVGELSADNCGLDIQATDLATVMDHFGVERAHVLGFCTGADVAIRFAAMCPHRVASLTLANGALWSERAPRTPFQEKLGKVMPGCAMSARHAELYHALIYGHANAREQTRDLDTWNALLDTLDPSLVHMTSLAFRSPELLHRYAVMMTRYHQDSLTGAAQIGAPTLVLTDQDDPIAHAAASVAFAARTPSAVLKQLDGSGHFGLHLDPESWATVATFLAVHSAEPTQGTARMAG